MKSKHGKAKSTADASGETRDKRKKDGRDGAADASDDGETAQVARILGAREPLTDVQRAAFQGRFSEAQCDELGGRAKSGPVFREGLSWAAQIEATLADDPEGLRYSGARFSWYLECLLELARVREAHKRAQASLRAAERRLDTARATALAARDELRSLLGELAGGVDADLAALALAGARGSSSDNGALAGSLRALAGLADGWLCREGEVDRALVASSGLTHAHAHAAWEAADALERADGEKPREGRIEVRDVPAVRRAEGRLLREMGVAMRSFAEAHGKNDLIKKLSPGPATRDVLKKSRAIGAAGPGEAPPEPPAVTDAEDLNGSSTRERTD